MEDARGRSFDESAIMQDASRFTENVEIIKALEKELMALKKAKV